MRYSVHVCVASIAFVFLSHAFRHQHICTRFNGLHASSNLPLNRNEGSDDHKGEERDDAFEFLELSKDEDSKGAKLYISKRLWRVLMGLLVYRSKYGNYDIDVDFIFGPEDGPKLNGYKLGARLNTLLDMVDLYTKDIKLFTKRNELLKRNRSHFPTCDIVQAPRLLWLLGFPTAAYLQQRDESVVCGALSAERRLRRWGLLKHMTKEIQCAMDNVRGPPLGPGDDDDDYEDNAETLKRVEHIKDVILQYHRDNRQRVMDSLIFSKPQMFPEPARGCSIRPNLMKQIVSELLESYQIKGTGPLIQRPTRKEIEGGHHYEFFHWTFEQVLQAMVLFNDLYLEHNGQMLDDKKGSMNAGGFEPITFNTLLPSWRIPETEAWPEEFWGMPLGLFIEKIRCGDVDAKEHWLRRPILDAINFDWGDGLKYFNFTWDKLERGLVWFVNYRGFEIQSMHPFEEIRTTTTAIFGKPEEINGLKIGHLFYMAIDQMQMIQKHYPDRYRFLYEMGLNKIDLANIRFGYKPNPHAKLNVLGQKLWISTDEKYLRDQME